MTLMTRCWGGRGRNRVAAFIRLASSTRKPEALTDTKAGSKGGLKTRSPTILVYMNMLAQRRAKKILSITKLDPA